MGSYYDKLKAQMDDYNYPYNNGHGNMSRKNSQSCNLPESFPPYYMGVDYGLLNFYPGGGYGSPQMGGYGSPYSEYPGASRTC